MTHTNKYTLDEIHYDTPRKHGTDALQDETWYSTIAGGGGMDALLIPFESDDFKKIKPINVRKLTEINFQADENINEIKYSFCENNKDLRSLAKKMGDGIIYNESNEKFYAVNDKKTTLIARNKSGKELTDKYFGDNMTLFTNKTNNTVDNSATASKGQSLNIEAFEKRILALETKIESLKQMTGPQGERGPKGEPGSSSVDTDIITGINKKISSLEKAVELDQKLPSSNSNNINYYINRNYEDIKSNSTQFSSVFSRLAASELLIQDLTSVIGTLTGKIEALELGA
jgi:hypothetical protein